MRLTEHLPMRIVDTGEQYYVCTLLGWRFYLHRFLRSDPAGVLHDSIRPREFTLVLSGQYWLETRCGRRRVRWFDSMAGDLFHRIALPQRTRVARVGNLTYSVHEDVECWTLSFHRIKGAIRPHGNLYDVRCASGVLYKPNHPNDGAMLFVPCGDDSRPARWSVAKPRREMVLHGATSRT